MKLNLGDTLILAAFIGCMAGLAIFLSKGYFMDAYFPGMMCVGFFLWFFYRKGEDFRNMNKK